MRSPGPRFVAALAALAGSACGGGMPMLHDAHTLPEGVTELGAGLSGQIAVGPARDDMSTANAVGNGSASTTGAAGNTAAVGTPATATYTKGALAAAAFAPGVAPWLGVRQGLPYDTEAGVTWTGRALALDARWALQGPTTALSIGLGGHVLSPRRDEGRTTPLAGLDLDSFRGGGVDVPLLVGWRSRAGLVRVWAGPRASFDKLGGLLDTGGPGDDATASVDAQMWSVGGVIGMSFGFRRLRGAIELDGAWQRVSGTVGQVDVRSTGITLAPAAALITQF